MHWRAEENASMKKRKASPPRVPQAMREEFYVALARQRDLFNGWVYLEWDDPYLTITRRDHDRPLQPRESFLLLPSSEDSTVSEKFPGFGLEDQITAGRPVLDFSEKG